MSADRFLAKLTEALIAASEHDPPKTEEFAAAMDRIVPVFDHLGMAVLSSIFQQLQLDHQCRSSCRDRVAVCEN